MTTTLFYSVFYVIFKLCPCRFLCCLFLCFIIRPYWLSNFPFTYSILWCFTILLFFAFSFAFVFIDVGSPITATVNFSLRIMKSIGF
jgi:hypothetical protein